MEDLLKSCSQQRGVVGVRAVTGRGGTAFLEFH